MRLKVLFVTLGVVALTVNACGGSASDGDGDGDGGGDGSPSGGDEGAGGSDTGAGGTSSSTGGSEMGGTDNMGGGSASCSKQSDCDDDDVCTEDHCTNRSCENTPLQGLCGESSSACLDSLFELGMTSQCQPSYKGNGVELCHTTDCSTEETVGCDVEMTFGALTAEVTTDDGVRTTVYTLPMTELVLSGDLEGAGAECDFNLLISDGEIVPITITVDTGVVAACGEPEEILDITTEGDFANVVVSAEAKVVDHEDECALAQGLLRTSLRADIERQLLEYVHASLGDLNAFVGAECGSCSSGDCRLACDPATLAE